MRRPSFGQLAPFLVGALPWGLAALLSILRPDLVAVLMDAFYARWVVLGVVALSFAAGGSVALGRWLASRVPPARSLLRGAVLGGSGLFAFVFVVSAMAVVLFAPIVAAFIGSPEGPPAAERELSNDGERSEGWDVAQLRDRARQTRAQAAPVVLEEAR